MEVDCIYFVIKAEGIEGGLNPCCDGSRLYDKKIKHEDNSKFCLNPCCDGSRLYNKQKI